MTDASYFTYGGGFMKRRTVSILVVAILALAVVSAAASKPDVSIIYDRQGNALIAYGGDKGDIPTFSATSFCSTAELVSTKSLFGGSFSLSKWRSTSYGNGSVRTEFISTVEWGTEWTYVWREVSGQSMTYWTGSTPQEFSDVIELDEYWKFGGLSVSVSYPGGVGASGSGSTIYWSGDDGGTGTHWYLAHIYSGYYGQSYISMTYVKQSSDGSHRFDCVWVSACATDQDSP
jgi:hypothetical protein